MKPGSNDEEEAEAAARDSAEPPPERAKIAEALAPPQHNPDPTGLG